MFFWSQYSLYKKTLTQISFQELQINVKEPFIYPSLVKIWLALFDIENSVGSKMKNIQ